MKKSTILLSALVLGLTMTSPAYARSHGHHSSHGSHHSSHGSHHSVSPHHDSHISGHKSPSTKSPSKSPSTKLPSKSPSTKSPSTKPSTKSSKSTNPSKSTKPSESTKPSKSTKKDYSIKHPYNDQEAFDVFKSNKLQSSYQKAYRRQSIFNNPWIWMYFISHHNNQYHASHNKVNTEYAKGYRDGWTKGETTTDPYKENKSLRYQSKSYRQGYKDGYTDAQKQRKED